MSRRTEKLKRQLRDKCRIASEEGWKACDDRLPESANPYPSLSEEHRYWKSAWYDNHYQGYEELYNCGGY